MPEAPYDLKANHPLLPHPKSLELYQENKFKYDKTVQDLNYERWYNETKKVGKISTGKITILINQMYRHGVWGLIIFSMMPCFLGSTEQVTA